MTTDDCSIVLLMETIGKSLSLVLDLMKNELNFDISLS